MLHFCQGHKQRVPKGSLLLSTQQRLCTQQCEICGRSAPIDQMHPGSDSNIPLNGNMLDKVYVVSSICNDTAQTNHTCAHNSNSAATASPTMTDRQHLLQSSTALSLRQQTVQKSCLRIDSTEKHTEKSRDFIALLVGVMALHNMHKPLTTRVGLEQPPMRI